MSIQRRHTLQLSKYSFFHFGCWSINFVKDFGNILGMCLGWSTLISQEEIQAKDTRLTNTTVIQQLIESTIPNFASDYLRLDV